MDAIKTGHIDEQIREVADTRSDKSLEQRKAEAISNIKLQERVQQQIGEKGINLIRLLDQSSGIKGLSESVNNIKKLAEDKAKLGSPGALLLLDYSIDVIADMIDKPAISDEWSEEYRAIKESMVSLREKLRAQLEKPRE